jgi:hypothetical protein
MRHWLLIFLIALLPLRGWAASGMATQMATQTMVVQQVPAPSELATDTVANYRVLTGTTSQFNPESSANMALQVQPDCHGVVTPPSPIAPAAQSAECGSTCGVCQVCHSVALTVSLPPAMLGAPAQGVVSVSLPTFTSADRALSQKPPIA